MNKISKQSIENIIRHNRVPFVVHQLFKLFEDKDLEIEKTKSFLKELLEEAKSYSDIGFDLTDESEKLDKICYKAEEFLKNEKI